MISFKKAYISVFLIWITAVLVMFFIDVIKYFLPFTSEIFNMSHPILIILALLFLWLCKLLFGIYPILFPGIVYAILTITAVLAIKIFFKIFNNYLKG